VHEAFFFPDAKHILELGNVMGGHGLKLWVQDINGGTPRAISPEGIALVYRSCISPDGKRVAARDPLGKITIYPFAGGEPVTVPNTQQGEIPVQWTADSKSLFVGTSELPVKVFSIDLASGQRRQFKSYPVADPTGLFDTAPPNLSRDLKTYVYSYTRITSDLYVVDGLK
jgi:hypothetical protein